MNSNETLFDDLAGKSLPFLRAIQDLAAANKEFADTTIASNKRIKASLVELKAEMESAKQVVLALNVAQKGNGPKMTGLKDDVSQTVAAYKEKEAAIKANNHAIDLNTASVAALKKRLTELKQEYDSLDRSEAANVARMQDIEKEIRKTAAVTNELTSATQRAAKSNNAAVGSYDALTKHLNNLRARLKALPDAFVDGTHEINKFNKEAVDLSEDIAKADVALKRMDGTMGQFGRNVGNYPKQMQGASLGIGGLAKSFFALAVVEEVSEKIVDFGKDVLEITGRFEKYNAILATTLGSTQAGAAAFAMIQSFAAKTNFGVDELTDSYIKLANRGLRPGQEELMKLADVSNATGKPMKDLVEAISDINNSERWNEFGIKAKTNGDKVSLTFKGVTKEVDRTESGVLSAITAFGEMSGVMGMTATISGTLDGQTSNLGDNFDRLKTTIGGDTKNAFQDLIRFANILIDTFILVWQGTLPIREGFGIMVDAAADVGREIVSLVKSFFDIKDASDGASFALNTINGAFKLVASAAIAALANFQLLVGGLNVLLNKAKEVSNFFGSDFHIDPGATFENLVANFKKAGTRIVDIWDDTKKKVGGNPSTPGAIPPPIINKPTVDTKKAQQEAEKAMKASIDKQKALTKKGLSELELVYKQGNLTEAQYIEERAQMEQAGVFKIQKILKNYGKQKTSDYVETETELNGIAGKLAEERKKIEDKAWKDALAAVKDGLKLIEDQTKWKLTSQIANLDKAYAQGEGDIERRLAKRTITEAQANNELFDLKSTYLESLGKLTNDAIDEDDRRSKELLDKLKTNAKTEEQIKEVSALSAEEIGKNALDRDKANADTSVKITEDAEKKKTDAVKREADRRQKIEDLLWEVAAQSVSTYFDITNSFREKDLENINAQKEHELEMAGDNADAKKAIEIKFDQQSRAIKRRQAINERVGAAFSIGINTAMAITKNTAQLGFLPAIPINILTGILGGLQLATVLAKPLPAFKDGKNMASLDTYEGTALAGEAGRELWLHDNKIDLLSKPTLIDVGRTDRIFPSGLTERLLADDQAFAASALLSRIQQHKVAEWTLEQGRLNYQASMLARGIMNGPSADAIGKAVAEHLQKLPFDKIEIDERGFTRSVVEGTTKRIIRNNKRHLGNR